MINLSLMSINLKVELKLNDMDESYTSTVAATVFKYTQNHEYVKTDQVTRIILSDKNIARVDKNEFDFFIYDDDIDGNTDTLIKLKEHLLFQIISDRQYFI